MEKEEGEMSDDNSMQVDVDSVPEVLYKSAKEGLIVHQLDKVDAAKLEERAKRFGLNLTGNRVITQKQIDELYHNFGIESGNERHFRFDTLHLNGVSGLKTKELFEYLEDYKPVSLEWVDENACNVVCQDHISTALALLVHSREIKDETVKEMLAAKSSYHWREGMPHPKKDLILMRFATNADKKIPIKKDERHPKMNMDQTMLDSAGKNPWGDLCQTWGVYDHQEFLLRKVPVERDGEKYKVVRVKNRNLAGRLGKRSYEEEFSEESDSESEVLRITNKNIAKRLGKRSYEEKVSAESDSDSEWKKKIKTPRMRMHADDEESKIKKKMSTEITAVVKSEPSDDEERFAPLSIEIINSESRYAPRANVILSDKFKSHKKTNLHSNKDSVHTRLGVTVNNTEKDLLSDDYEEDDSYPKHSIRSRLGSARNPGKDRSSDEDDNYRRRSIHSRLDMSARKNVQDSSDSESYDKDNHGTKSVQSRLGVSGRSRRKRYSSDENDFSSDDSSHNVMSRVQKVNKTKSSVVQKVYSAVRKEKSQDEGSTVWSRLESKSTSESQKDLRQMLKPKRDKNTNDLRGLIKKGHHDNLRIEVDNS